MKKTIPTLLFLFLLSHSAFATPARVVIIRHGEESEESGIHLSKKGVERSKELVDFLLEFGEPAGIFAAMPKEGKSHRSYETVLPLAQHLGMEVNTHYDKDETTEAAEDILEDKDYDGKVVVVAWEHKNIPALAKALGLKHPPEWGKSYDRVWILDYRGRKVNFQNIGQHLLPGDSE